MLFTIYDSYYTYFCTCLSYASYVLFNPIPLYITDTIFSNDARLFPDNFNSITITVSFKYVKMPSLNMEVFFGGL